MQTKTLLSFRQYFFAVTALLGLLIAWLPASAQTPQYIFPGSNPSYTGGANSWPLNATPTSGSNMCQWLYLNGDFTPTPPAGVNITTVYIKPTTSTSFTFTNLQIKMGNTTLTTLTSGTWNGGLTTVYLNSSASISTTANGWLQIPLQNVFYYTGGPLIFELSQTSSSSSGITVNQFSVSGRNGRMYGSTSNTSSGGADAATAVFGFDAAPANCSGTPLTPLVTSPAIPAATPHCAGATRVITASDPNLPVNGMAYQWQSATSATGPWTNVTTGSGATTLSYTTGPISTNTYFRIGATCTNSNITSYSAAYLVPVGSTQPGAITGASTYCPGDPEVYTVPSIPGGTFTWTLPPGWTGFSTSNTITVTPGPSTGAATIAVAVTTPCGPISIQRTRSISQGSAPSPPGTISGNTHICSNTAQTYTVLPVGGATGYVWTTPTGWVGASTTNTINATANTNSGTVTVKAINGCGSSTINTLPVQVIAALANPGNITGSDTVCSGSLLTYSINPVPGATSYTWTLPSGWSGTTTGTSIQTFAGSVSGSLRVTAYVSCAISPISSKNIAVVTTVNPAVTVSVPPATLCQGSTITITAVPNFPGTSPVYQWKKNGSNVTAFGPNYTTNTLLKGDSVSVTMTSSESCASNPVAKSNVLYPNITPSVTPGVSINTLPPINICKGTPVTFTTTSNAAGTAPVYQWYKNGAVIPLANGTTYTDATLNDGDTLTIGLVSNAVCALTSNALSNKVGVNVVDPVAPTVTITVDPSDYIYQNQPLTFNLTYTDGGATPDFQWQRNGVDIPFETGDSYSTSTLKPGDEISVRMLSYAPCVTPELVNSNIIALKSALSVATATAASQISLFPNPNNGRFTLSAEGWSPSQIGQQLRLDVINTLGQSVYHIELTPTSMEWKTQIDLGSKLADGRYMLRLSSADGVYKNTMPFILKQ